MNEKDWTGENGEFKHLTLKQRQDMKQHLLRASIYGSVTSVLERVETLSRLRVESTVAELKQKSLDLLKDLDECDYHKVNYERLADLRSLVGDLESPTSTIIDCKKSLKEVLERLSKDYAALKEWSAPNSPPKKCATPPGDSDGGSGIYNPMNDLPPTEITGSQKVDPQFSTPANKVKPVIEYVDMAKEGSSYYSRPVGDAAGSEIQENVDCPCRVGLGCESIPPHTPVKKASQTESAADDTEGDSIIEPLVPKRDSLTLSEDELAVKKAAKKAVNDVVKKYDEAGDKEPLVDFNYQKPLVLTDEQIEELVRSGVPYVSSPGFLTKVAENVSPGKIEVPPKDKPLKEPPVGLEEIDKPVQTPYVSKPGFIRKVSSRVDGLVEDGEIEFQEKDIPDSKVKKIIENLEKRGNFRKDNFGIPPEA